MARRMIDIKIRGFDELKRKLSPELYADATRQILKVTAGKVAATAIQGAPDSLKKIVPRVSRRNPPHSASVRVAKSGTGKRARFIHGRTRPSTMTRTKPHFPPFDPHLRRWAKRRGVPVFVAARAIARRGAPFKKFMTRARDAHGGTLQAQAKAAFPLIDRIWSR